MSLHVCTYVRAYVRTWSMSHILLRLAIDLLLGQTETI